MGAEGITSDRGRAGLSPRAVGVAVALVGTAGSVGAAFFLSNPAWGIIAALVLAAASVVTAFGVLLTRRKDWSDKTWPPGSPARAWDTRRLRRQTLTSGVFLLIVGAVAAIGAWDAGFEQDSDPTRVWVVVGIFGAMGATLTAAALLPVRPPVTSDEQPTDDGREATSRWIQLGADGSAMSLNSVIYGGSGLYHVQLPFLLIPLLFFLLDLGPGILVVVVAAALVVTFTVVVVARRRAQAPWVARDGSALRKGTHEIAADDIRSAYLLASPWVPDATERNLSLTIESAEGFRVAVGLRRHGRLVLPRSASAALTVLISRSAIDLPRDKDDPSGRFSRVLYPTHLTRSQALTLVEHPPADGEALPVGAQPRG